MKIFRLACALWFAGFISAHLAHAATFTVSPTAVSNTYAGYVTLQVTGLGAGHAVQVQKYLDANTNGVIDAGDILRQQFTLTDGLAGMVIGGVTNVNVPGDTDSTAGQITAQWNFATDNSQSIIGKYLFRVSSLSGDFATPFTNSFNVTNAAYSQGFAGNVVNNGTNVSNAAVILFVPSANHINFVGGTMANNSGAYSMQAPPGTYVLMAAGSNFLASAATAPVLTLTGGQTITTNLTLTNATQTISGKIVDATNSSIGLPGVIVPANSTTNNWLALAFTDSSGNFSIGVRPDSWKLSKNESGVGAYGYVTTQNSKKADTSTGSVANVTISYPKATALFYGTLKDNLNNPLSGVDMSDSDNSGQYESDSRTDANGYFTLGAICSNSWQVQVSSDSNIAFTNYNFSQPALDQNGGTNLSCGQALQVNFGAQPATNHITGWVRDGSRNPLANIQVTAYSGPINGSVYQAQGLTDGSGNYSLNVAAGNWTVNLCCGCTGGCDNCLSTAYQCPGPQNLSNLGGSSNGVANFTAILCPALSIATPSTLPGAGLNVPYSFQFTNSGCSSPFTWSACSALPAGLNLNTSGNLAGTPTVAGSNYFCVQVMDNTSATTNSSFTLFVNRLTITTPSLFNGAAGAGYTNQLSADFGQPPYTWMFKSGSLPGGMGFSSAGVLSGIPTATGIFNFSVGVSDANLASTNKSFSLLINPKASAPPFRWAVKAGGTSEDQAFGLGVDGSGNAYLAGNFYSSPANFGGISLINKGSADAFVAKFSNAGSVIWAKSFGAEGDDEAFSLACDTSGNSYVCGWFTSTNIDFGTGPLTNAAPGTNNLFVAKFASSGASLWARSFGGVSGDQATRLSVDSSGNCYVTGLFGSTNINFGGIILTNAGAAGTWDVFLVKLSPNGVVVWAKSAGGTDYDLGSATAVDTSGNVYLVGQFASTNFNLGGILLTNSAPGAGTSDIFLAKFSSAGALLWVKQAGSSGDDVAVVGVDGGGNSYIAGFFLGSVFTFPGTSTSLTNTSIDGSEDFFVAKYNSVGALQWARQAVGDSYDDGRGIAVDAAGNCYIAGQFGSDSITFGNATLMNYGGTGGPADIFVVKYDPTGNVLWAKRAGGSKGDVGIKPALDPAGNLYLAGHFKSANAAFDSTTLASSGNWDVFVAMIDGSGPTLNIKLSGAQALLQWPTNRPGYILESEPALTNPPAWSTVTNPVGIVADQNTVTNSLSGAAKFYRLRSQ
jgi:hypothetical protein